MDDEEEGYGKNFLSYKTRIDRFQIDHLIGEGGYGQIYDVFDSSVTPNKHYAMKIEYLDSPKSALRVETLILKKIQGPECFPTYVSSGVTDSFRFLVMAHLYQLFGNTLMESIFLNTHFIILAIIWLNVLRNFIEKDMFIETSNHQIFLLTLIEKTQLY